MIVLSNSLPKTGSTLIANFQEDFLDSRNKKGGQAHLRSTYGGRFILNPSITVLWRLFITNLLKGDLVIKCHWNPTWILCAFCKLVPVRMTMAYRDPRDMILSMIDHGNRSREGEDKAQAYCDCENVVDLIPRTLRMLNELRFWRQKSYVHCIRYEELMKSPELTLQQMVNFIGWDVPHSVIAGVIVSRERTKYSSWNFNTGKTERWRTEMSAHEKVVCRLAFEPYLIELGYELD